MAHAAIEITSAAHFTEIVGSAGALPIIIDFTATWCPPCQMIKPIYEQLAQQYQGKAILVKVDVDDRADIAQQFGITCMPTFIAFVGGQVKEKMEGANKVGLEAMIAKYAAK